LVTTVLVSTRLRPKLPWIDAVGTVDIVDFGVAARQQK
jgi:hypothetical protein